MATPFLQGQVVERVAAGKRLDGNGNTIGTVEEGCVVTGNGNTIRSMEQGGVEGNGNTIATAANVTVRGNGNEIRFATGCRMIGNTNRILGGFNNMMSGINNMQVEGDDQSSDSMTRGKGLSSSVGAEMALRRQREAVERQAEAAERQREVMERQVEAMQRQSEAMERQAQAMGRRAEAMRLSGDVEYEPLAQSYSLAEAAEIIHTMRLEEGDLARSYTLAEAAGGLEAYGHRPPPQPVPVTYPNPVAESSLISDNPDDPRFCILCSDRERHTVLVPCGHIYACVTCIVASKPKECAFCKAVIEKVIVKHDA